MKIIINAEILQKHILENNINPNTDLNEFVKHLCNICGGEIVNDSLDDFINYAKEIGFSVEYFNGENTETSYYKLIHTI